MSQHKAKEEQGDQLSTLLSTLNVDEAKQVVEVAPDVRQWFKKGKMKHAYFTAHVEIASIRYTCRGNSKNREDWRGLREYISYVELGSKGLSLDTLNAFAKVLGAELKWKRHRISQTDCLIV